ncbi:MAG TPA: hypothetical protein VIC34_13025 [Croceibacterium sp.]|jgi:hypothetical protein
MNRTLVLGTAALALVATHAPARAQGAKPLTTLTQEQKDHGVETFRLIASAMQSENVPSDVKSVLMGCMYENPIGKISETVDSALAANPGKIDRTKPEQMLSVIAQVCGYEPPATGTAAPGKAPAAPGKPPAAPAGRPKGR